MNLITISRRIKLSFLTSIFLAFSISSHAQQQWTKVFSGHFGVQKRFLSAFALRFPTKDTGYAIVGADRLIRTTDGGQSWSEATIPPTLGQINYPIDLTFFGSSGWLLASESDTLTSAKRILHSTDYGFTWSLMQTDSTLMASAIYFKSPTLGYIWGPSFGTPQFWVTTDGGESWRIRTNPPCNFPSSSFALLIGQPNVILGEVDGSPINFQSSFYLSTDTGLTWTLNGSGIQIYGFDAMNYIGASTWVSAKGYTTDNGKNWVPVQTTAPFSGIITDTLGHGMFIPDSNSLYFTNDFGRSWDSLQVPISQIYDGVIIDRVEYILAPDSGGATSSLWRSVVEPSVVKQTEVTSAFRILTNPAYHFLQLSLEDTHNDIHIVDGLGRIIGSYLTQGSEYSIDISSLPGGLYWVVTREGAKPFVHVSQ